MAPLPRFMDTMWNVILPRDLGTPPPDYVAPPPYTQQEQHNLQVLAVSISSISVASAVLAFYWFRRMRRSFRHDLIMFLIQSDMFKALWFMLYPIVVFTYGPVTNDSKFCLVNGFFISVGIEASDFAVLMIALHSALYIFNANPRTAAGEGGLYPYRKIAFAAWAIFPILMASLAFINDRPYTSAGTYCYLPIRPFWYRLALSWIPRYVIFIIIIAIYASIYLYVRFKFRDFGKTSPVEGSHSTITQKNRKAENVQKRYSLPATPPLIYNGLLPESRQGSMTMSESAQGARKLSEGTLEDGPDLTSPRASTSNAQNRPIWTKSKGQTESDETASTTLAPNNLHPTSIDIASPKLESPPEIPIPESRSTTWSNFTARFHMKSAEPTEERSTLSFLSFLRRQPQHPDLSSYASTPISQLELVNSRGQNVASSEIRKTREKIRRQLRFMFIYPLVYIAMWILPFVSHVLQYNDRYASHPPYVLSAFVAVMVNAQCAVDCWLFSTREKPWRHIPGTTGGFFESLRFWEAGWGLPQSLQSRRKEQRGPGKSRAEMVAEARRAYLRRDEEIQGRRRELEEIRNVGREERERSWWDGGVLGGIGQGGDGAMSPVAEEAGQYDFISEPVLTKPKEAAMASDNKRITPEPERKSF